MSVQDWYELFLLAVAFAGGWFCGHFTTRRPVGGSND